MYLKSPYPDVPPMPDMNVHQLCFSRPEQADWKDYTLHISAKTGRRRTYQEFLDRLQLGMTALGAPVAEGGLGLIGNGEMVGIMSPNSLVFVFLITWIRSDLACPRTMSRLCTRFSVSQYHLYPYLCTLHHSKLTTRSNCRGAHICS